MSTRSAATTFVDASLGAGGGLSPAGSARPTTAATTGPPRRTRAVAWTPLAVTASLVVLVVGVVVWVAFVYAMRRLLDAHG